MTGQHFEPDLRNSAVRDYRAAAGNVAMVELWTHLADRKGKDGNPLPTAGALALYPNPLIKENARQPNTYPTQSGKGVSQGLAGVRKAARENKEMKFTISYPDSATFPASDRGAHESTIDPEPFRALTIDRPTKKPLRCRPPSASCLQRSDSQRESRKTDRGS